MNRVTMVDRLADSSRNWDIVIIGGGATGAGIAVDSASRGYSTLLVEKEDFGKASSSRSTKLIHGGVRYLEQGNFTLVKEALKERELLLRNAPHLVSELEFIIPSYSWWEIPFYGIGLGIYDLLARKAGLGKTRMLSKNEVLNELPTLLPTSLLGGLLYSDGKFDDARLLIHLILTAVDHGATVVNYAEAVSIHKNGSGRVDGITVNDRETKKQYNISAKVVINASGIFTDQVRNLSTPNSPTTVRPSQGIHMVFDRDFLPGNKALLIPRTSDGRVLFAIPWLGRTLVGTTDTAIKEISYEPKPQDDEVDFILDTIGKYLSKRPTRQDVLSVFAGIRPLANSQQASSRATSAMSRDHTIDVDDAGLLSIVGGKWTTYRLMAEDCVNEAARLGNLPPSPCQTETMPVHRWERHDDDIEPASSVRIHPNLPYVHAEIIRAVRHEMCRTVDDALARRTRSLILDARAASECAPMIAALIAHELGRDHLWVEEQVSSFRALARQYVLSN